MRRLFILVFAIFLTSSCILLAENEKVTLPLNQAHKGSMIEGVPLLKEIVENSGCAEDVLRETIDIMDHLADDILQAADGYSPQKQAIFSLTIAILLGYVTHTMHCVAYPLGKPAQIGLALPSTFASLSFGMEAIERYYQEPEPHSQTPQIVK